MKKLAELKEAVKMLVHQPIKRLFSEAFESKENEMEAAASFQKCKDNKTQKTFTCVDSVWTGKIPEREQ